MAKVKELEAGVFSTAVFLGLAQNGQAGISANKRVTDITVQNTGSGVTFVDLLHQSYRHGIVLTVSGS